MSSRTILVIFPLLVAGVMAHGASVIVAPSTASEKAKARADYVCDGQNDQVELLASLTDARKYPVLVDRSPFAQIQVVCYGKHSVEWLPGDYFLSDTLEIPNSADVAIEASGTYFHYGMVEGDAVVVRGMNRCRYDLGTIETKSSGAALRIKPVDMPSLMSIVDFTGLIGSERRGTGLYVDSSEENVCTLKVEGTDIAHFDTGVRVGAGAASVKGDGHGKTDTNWFWFSYIRRCNTNIHEENRGVDDNVYMVNIDASAPNSVAARIGGVHSRWYMILGTVSYWKYKDATKSIVFEPDARSAHVVVNRPREFFAPWEDKSGNDTNTIVSASGQLFRDERSTNTGLQNDGFESALRGWTPAATARSVLEEPKSGRRCLELEGGVDESWVLQDYTEIAALRGKTITVRAWAKAEAADRCRLRLIEHGGKASDRVASAYHTGDGKWRPIQATKKIGADAVRVRIRLEMAGGAKARAYFDDVRIVILD